MAAIEQLVPNLLGGVSQQPDPLKLPGQVKTATNVQLDPTFGALKRAGTELTGSISDIPQSAKWIPILRDREEQYWACIYYDTANTRANIRVFNIFTGAEVAVNFDGDSREYLMPDPTDSGATVPDPSTVVETNWDRLRSLTIGDYTFIANPEIQPSTYEVAETRRPEALITIGAAGYGTTYIVDFNEENSDQTSARWQVTDLEAPNSRKTSHTEPVHAGEETINDWNGTGLAFRVKIDARAYLRDDGKKYGHQYIPYVTLLNGGNNTAEFPSTIPVTINDYTWDIKVAKQNKSTVYASIGTATFTTPSDQSAGGASVSDIVGGLQAAINAITGLEAETVGNVLRVRYTNATRTDEFTVSARGGTSGDGLDSIKYSVDNLAMLPTDCWNGYKVAVRNTQDSETDDYYVSFKADVAASTVPGSGYWTETVKTGEGGGLNDSSMPHVLVRESNGEFKFSSLNNSSYGKTWADRSVGTAETNPHPTFTDAGSYINSMFMYKNRLGFLTQDAVVMSQVGDYFNFYATSGVTISDADPVDMATSDTKPVKLEAAVATTSGAILFGNQAQFRLASPDETFGPKTANLDKLSNFNYESDADPIQTGVSVMFPTDMGTFSSIYEMSTESVKGTPVIEDNSRVIPRFIPSGLKWSCSSMNNDTVFFGDKSNNVYVFRFFNEGQERKVAGWTKWTFRHNVLNMAAYQDKLYLVFQDDETDRVWLTTMYLNDTSTAPISAGEFTYLPRVDKQVDSTETTYLNRVAQDREDTYEFTTAYDSFTASSAVTVIYTDTNAGDFEYKVIDSNRQFTVDKDRPFIVGFTYTMLIQLPNFYVKQEQRADRISDVMVQGVYFDMYQSSGIDVLVNMRGYDPYNGYLTPIDADTYDADSAAMRVSGTEFLGMAAPGSQTFVSMTSVNPYPTGLTSYSFQGIYNKRGYATIR